MPVGAGSFNFTLTIYIFASVTFMTVTMMATVKVHEPVPTGTTNNLTPHNCLLL